MKKITIFDTTLRDGEQSPGFSMNLQEKLEMALQLERLGVDVMEAGFAAASPGDLHSIQTIAAQVKNASICSLSRALTKDIDASWEAVKHAVSPRIHIFIATSPIHMQYKLRMEPDKVVEQAAAMVAYAKQFCDDIQFSAEDASRSDPDFLVRILEAVIKAGATTLNIPDTVGYSYPSETQALIAYLKEHTQGIEKAALSVHCHNDLGLASANTLAGVLGGATQVEVTVNGIGERAGNASLEEVAMSLSTRQAYFDASCRIDTTQIYPTSRLLQSITGISVTPNKAIVGANAFAHESGIHQHGVMMERTTYEIMTPASIGLPENKMVLGKHSGRHAFEQRLTELGFSLPKEELDAAFERFKKLADKKKVIHDRDLEALAGGHTQDVRGVVSLEHFVINSGSSIDGTAIIKVTVDGEERRQVAIGDGPVDAAFQAINALVGKDFALDSYSLNAITEGKDALGECVLRLSLDDKTVTGRSVSTDVIAATLQAYVNAINTYFITH